MSFETILFICVAIGIIYLTMVNHKALKVKRELKKHSITPLAEVKDDELVRVKAKVVVVGKTLIAPLSERVCVYYNVKVSENRNKTSTAFNVVDVSETRITEIVLREGNHYALVNKSTLCAHVVNDHIEYTGMLYGKSEQVEAFLKRKGEYSKGVLGFPLDLTAEEGILEEGETLELLGRGKWLPSKQFQHLKIPAEKVLFLNPADQEGVYLTDEEMV